MSILLQVKSIMEELRDVLNAELDENFVNFAITYKPILMNYCKKLTNSEVIPWDNGFHPNLIL